MLQYLAIGWAKIASGNIAAGVLRLLGLAIAARSLDLASFGLLVLIEAYVRVIDGLLNFQSVNVLTRYLAEAEHADDAQRFRGFLKAGFLIDATTAVATCLLAISLLPAIHGLIGIPADWVTLAMIFCAVIATRILGTAEAVLRCFDRYWSIGLREAISSALVVAASLVAWRMGGGAWIFLLIWMGAEATANIAFLIWTVHVLRARGITAVHRADARAAVRAAPEFWPLLWQTNLTSGIRILTQHGDMLVVGAVLGPTAAGLLRAAKNLASLVSQFGRPLQQVSSAQIARLWADGRGSTLLVYNATICATAATAGLAIAAVFLVAGQIPLTLVFGPEYIQASGLLAIIMLAEAVYLAGITLLPTMVTLGLGKQFLYAILGGTTAYALVLGTGIKPFELYAVAWAHFAIYFVWAILGWGWVIHKIRATMPAKQSNKDPS